MVGQSYLAILFACVALTCFCPNIRAEEPQMTLKFQGGDGSSLEHAVVILGAATESAGVGAEHAYLSLHFPGSAVVKQAFLQQDGKAYDRLQIRTSANTSATIYFDVTDFIGKF
jgi:hypothetical protein